MDVVEIRIDEIVWDVCQTRVQNDEATVDYYAERMVAGDIFPPIVTFSVDGYAPFYCGDGVHRILACERCGIEVIKARTFQGGRDRARLYSATESNYASGLPLSPADRRQRVREVLSLKPSWSINKIAQECRVAWHTANDVAEEVGGFSDSQNAKVDSEGAKLPKPPGSQNANLGSRVEGADGKSYPRRVDRDKQKDRAKRLMAHTKDREARERAGKKLKNGSAVVNLNTKNQAWKLYGQLCRALSELNLDQSLLSEMDAIGMAIKSLK